MYISQNLGMAILKKVITLEERHKEVPTTRPTTEETDEEKKKSEEEERLLKLLPPMPFEDLSSLLLFSRSLKNNGDLKNALILRINKAGGSDPTAVIKRIFKIIMNPELKVKFSWSGQRRPNYPKKLPFKKLELCNVMISAIVENKRYDVALVERKIIISLQHANEQLERVKKEKETESLEEAILASLEE